MRTTTTQTFDLNPTRITCRSCGATLQVGLTAVNSPQRNAIYCDEACLLEPPVTPEEERNDIWRALNGLGVRGIDIARMWDVKHPAVYREFR